MLNVIENGDSEAAFKFDTLRKLAEAQLRIVVPGIATRYEESLERTTDPNKRTLLITDALKFAFCLGEAGLMPRREEFEAEAGRIFEDL